MEELLIYASDLLSELDELEEECHALIDQRATLMGVWGNDDVDPMDISSRIQTIDAMLSVNYKLMADSYSELKRVDKEIGWCMTEPPNEEEEENPIE